MADTERKRELALPPGTYAYILDSTKGLVKLHVGPLNLNQTGQDRPVRFDRGTHGFAECSLEQAMQQSVVVPEGFYAVLTNPAKSKDGKTIYPETGRAQDTPELSIGLKENVTGPVDFALYPGQTCDVRRGHHLRSNEYLRVKIYNEERARENWTKAVVRSAEGGAAAPARQAPADLAVGKHYNVLGTEVSFYIPPTGVSVVPEDGGSFVRAAETLEQLEYSILVDEDGNKEYPRGPRVVFPKPTQKFMLDGAGNRKFRAIEMNELQGIQLKFISPVSLTMADGTERRFAAGEEVFLTGKEMPIYYPAEGHQMIKYDGKTIHYAVAVPEGEARYVMDRKTGAIRTVRGPTMLLPDPVTEIIVRRALSDEESAAMFPGPDGSGSKESLEYNRWLRRESAKEPTTRQGVVSEGRLELQGAMATSGPVMGATGLAMPMNLAGAGGFDSGGQVYASNSPQTFANAADAVASLVAQGVLPAERGGRRGGPPKVPESRQGKPQDAVVGDVAERGSRFNEPRTLTFAGKFRGVPTIKVRQGYAVQVADADGGREVVLGPATVLLDYGQSLDVLSLSTGKPKTTDKLFRTAYLRVSSNRVSDVVIVETSDHVRVLLKLVHQVDFEGDPGRWFSVENYVKHLCDHARSVLKGAVRKVPIERFYADAAAIVRGAILGAPIAEGGRRPGMTFEANGMRVTDVEVLDASITDDKVSAMLATAQREAVESAVTSARDERAAADLERREQLARRQASAKEETAARVDALTRAQLERRYDLQQAESGFKEALAQQEHDRTVAAEDVADLAHARQLRRKEQELRLAVQADRERMEIERERLRAEVEAAVTRFGAAQGGFSEALLALSNQDTLVKVAEAMSVQNFVGGKTLTDVLDRIFEGTPLSGAVEKVKALAGRGPTPRNGSTEIPKV